MPTAVIENLDRFNAFLAAQPLCLWAAEKRQQQTAAEAQRARGRPAPRPADDNAELLAALSSMA